MFKNLVTVAFLLITGTAAQAGDDKKITSKVQKVTVFLNGAQVTRTATANVNAGTSDLVFEGISPDVDVQSIQVHADGEFTILSVKHELNFLNEQVKQKQVEELRIQQKQVKSKIAVQNSLFSVYQEEENMLSKNQVVTGENASLDVLKLKQALDFHTERLTQVKEKEREVEGEIATLNTELQKYDKQIAAIAKDKNTSTSNIIVTVSSKAALESLFTLSYVVHNAGWYPTYDIRAKNVNSPVTISYKANVAQQSGEDWKNIKLTLSTGNPTVSGSKPELSPDYLNLGMYYPNSTNVLTKISGVITASDDRLPVVGAAIKIKGTSIGTVTDVNGNFTMQIPAGAQTIVVSYIGYETQEYPISGGNMNISLTPAASTLNEVVVTGYAVQRKSDITGAESMLEGQVAGVNIGAPGASKQVFVRGISSYPVEVSRVENQTNIEFNIATPYSVPCDGKQYTVEITQVNLAASYEYAVAPKISTDVFLTAKIADWNNYNFLPGEANLFFEGTFIGKSLLDANGTADTLNISLGADKNIVVTRTTLKDLSQRQSFGSNKKELRDWQIEVKNRKSQAINLLVEDQVPVSQNTSIEVDTQELSGGKLDQNTGKILWNFHLKPEADKKLELKYQVKYPQNQSVIVD